MTTASLPPSPLSVPSWLFVNERAAVQAARPAPRREKGFALTLTCFLCCCLLGVLITLPVTMPITVLEALWQRAKIKPSDLTVVHTCTKAQCIPLLKRHYCLAPFSLHFARFLYRDRKRKAVSRCILDPRVAEPARSGRTVHMWIVQRDDV